MNPRQSFTLHFALLLLLIGGMILVFPAPSAAQDAGVIYYRTSPFDLSGQPATMVHLYRFFPNGTAVGGGIGFVGATIDSVWQRYANRFVPGNQSVGTYTYAITGTTVTFFGTSHGVPITYTGELRDPGRLVVDYPMKDGSVQQFEYQYWQGPPLVPSGPVGSQGQTTRSSNSTRGNTPFSGDVGDPVSTSIGEYYFEMPLLDLGGPLPLRFALYYAANLDKSPGAHNDPFGGDNFSHNFYITLKRVDDATAVVLFGDGNLVRFRKTQGWQAVGEEIVYQLQENDKRYYLLAPISELVYTFDKATVSNTPVGVLTRIEDRRGNALVFANDKAGRVTRIDDGLGRSLTFTYANPTDKWTWQHLVQVTDAYSRTVEFGYQTTTPPVLTAHLTGVTDALGLTTVFTHTGPLTDTVVAARMLPRGNTPYTEKYPVTSDGAERAWQVTEQKDAAGNTIKLALDKGVMTLTDAAGNVTQQTHQDDRRLSALKDAAGKTATFGYDDAGRRTTITDRMGDATKLTYHAPTGKLASITNARGETMTLTYTPQDQAIGPDKIPFTFYNLTRVDYTDRTNEQFTYDAKGNIVTMVDRVGQSWKYTYNSRGQVLTATNPTGGIVTYTYNADATLASRKDSDLGETTFTYDHLKRLVKIADAVGQMASLTYDANDRITALTDANNRTTKFEYDANGNLVKIIDPNNKATALEYDAMDRVTKMTDRVGQIGSSSYDVLGRLASVADATGIKTEYAYDPRGWLNAITRSDATYKFGYDDEGMIISATTPAGNASALKRDKLGLLVGATDALGNTTTLTRDALSRITGITDPLNRTTSYAYDARGLLSSVTLPVVGAVKYERDALGNLTKVADLNGAEWKFAYTPMGRLKSITDAVGQIVNLTYDARGRLNKIAFADNSTTALTYDAAGNLTRSQFSDGTDLPFAYDALNRLIETDGVKLAYDAEGRITNTSQCVIASGAKQSPTSAGDCFVAQNAPRNDVADYGATYDDAGRLKTVTYGNALTVTYMYDAKTGLLTQVADSLTKTQVDFTYDQNRRLVGIARSNKVNTTLTWDKASRLTRIQDAGATTQGATTQGSPLLDLQYTLDAAGQVTSAKMRLPLDPTSNLQPLTSNLQFDAASQLKSTGYQYDARGRLTQSPNHQFTWDGASRLVGIQSSVTSQQSSVALTYDGLGQVTSRTESGKTTRYFYNYALGLAPIVAESEIRNPQSEIPSRYYILTPGGQLLYMIDAADNKVYHYHFDRMGSTLALTNQSGAITDAYAYDPYGQLLAHEGNSAQPFTFVGKWGVRQEGATGTLYQMRARYYDATTARFLSREPLLPQIQDPRQLNPYQYALNDPVNVVDRNGMTPEQVFALWLERLTGGQQSSAWQLWLTGEAFTYNEAEAVSFLTLLDQIENTAGERETIYKAMRNVTETVTIPLPPPIPPPEESESCLPDVREGIHTGNIVAQRVGLPANTLSGESTIARTVGASKAAWHKTPLKNLTPTSKINVWQGAKVVGRTCTLTAGALSYIEIGMHFTKTPAEISQETGENLTSWNPLVRGPAELGNLIGNWLYGD